MRLRAVAALVAALLTAAGCASSEGDDAYVKTLNQAQAGLAKRFGALQRNTAPTAGAQEDARTLRAYEAAVSAAVGRLRKVDPPDDLGALHRRFVSEIAGYGTALRTARGELRAGDAREILGVQGRLAASVARTGDRLNATIAAINQKLKG